MFKIGDLVTVKKDIKEYYDVLGSQVGIVIQCKSQAELFALSIMWPSGEIEALYSDEVALTKKREVINDN